MNKPTNLKKGDQFRVIEEDSDFKVGEIISLDRDDDSDYPFFWNADKSKCHCFNFCDLEPYPKRVRDAQVGDVLIRRDGDEHIVLERGQNSVLLSYENNFKKADGNYHFDELEEIFTLKAEPEVEQTVLTMSQIAEKFGVEVSTLKIAKE